MLTSMLGREGQPDREPADRAVWLCVLRYFVKASTTWGSGS
jgi:hypothetical protein